MLFLVQDLVVSIPDLNQPQCWSHPGVGLGLGPRLQGRTTEFEGRA